MFASLCVPILAASGRPWAFGAFASPRLPHTLRGIRDACWQSIGYMGTCRGLSASGAGRRKLTMHGEGRGLRRRTSKACPTLDSTVLGKQGSSAPPDACKVPATRPGQAADWAGAADCATQLQVHDAFYRYSVCFSRPTACETDAGQNEKLSQLTCSCRGGRSWGWG